MRRISIDLTIHDDESGTAEILDKLNLGNQKSSAATHWSDLVEECLAKLIRELISDARRSEDDRD